MRFFPIIAAGLISATSLAVPATADAQRHHGSHNSYHGGHQSYHGGHHSYHGSYHGGWHGGGRWHGGYGWHRHYGWHRRSRLVCGWHWRWHHRVRRCYRTWY